MKYMIYALLLIGTLLSSAITDAQSLKDLYVAHPQLDGYLYHIFPLTLFHHKANGDLTFDITYQQYRDSATVNFTYYGDKARLADSVDFFTATNHMNGKVKKIYIEAQKTNWWVHRYSLEIPVHLLYPFFNSEADAKVKIISQKEYIEYDSKKSDWKKKATLLHSVLETIRLEGNRD